jgi:hypoxanthine phosphoribosyltransferase
VAPPGVSRVLIPPDALAHRVAELGREVARDHVDRPPVLVGVLKGAVVFLADLIRAIDRPLTCDFIAVASYGAATRSSGIVRLTQDLSASIEGQDVVVVEDIVDTGRTLAYLLRNLETRQPRRLRVCVLLDKAARREVPVRLDYVGFPVPDEFVVGYGLDHDGLFRNLPYVAVLGGVEPPPGPGAGGR